MKRLAISLTALCVLEAGIIVYLWADRRDMNRFRYLTGNSAFDTRTGQACYAGTEEARGRTTISFDRASELTLRSVRT